MKMKKELDKNKKVVLYGAGTIGHSTYKTLSTSGYSIVYCVVTNDDAGEYEFEDVKVYPFMQKKNEIIMQGYQLVVASVRYEMDIIKNIKDNGISEFWTYSHMAWSPDFDKYKKLDSEGYLDIIRTKYLSNPDQYGKCDAIRDFVDNGIKKKVNNNKILFLLLYSSERAYKIIGALHRKGYTINIIIWTGAIRLTDEMIAQYSGISEQCILSYDIEEIMMHCAATDAKILHIFSHAIADLKIPQTLMHGKSIFPKIVFDEYDLHVEMRNGTTKEIVDAELFGLENADGLCSRYSCMEYLDEKGYEICKNRIYFMDYCFDNIGFASLQKEEQDELDLVYVGASVGYEMYGDMRCAKFLELGELCRKNNTHLHLYLNICSQQMMDIYKAAEKDNPCMHIHPPVPFDELPQEISKYDYGIMSSTGDFLLYGDIMHTKAAVSYLSANKLFSYLEAGLPIVSAFPVEQAKVFEGEGVLIRKTDEEIDFGELRRKRNGMKKRVVEVREKYKISNQVTRLIEFYDNL